MLPLILGIVFAVVAIGVFGLVFLQMRKNAETPARATQNQEIAPPGIIDEMRTLTNRIEKLFEAQQIQGETQRQQLAQEIDSVRGKIEEQEYLISGLRNELRYEIRRRDEELKALRHQIEAVETERPLLNEQHEERGVGGDSVAPAMDSIVLSAQSRNGRPPSGTNRLTVIDGIDESMQDRLYAVGVHTLDHIAHWGRDDARRMADELNVSEETILNEWIFAAQAALFERHQREFAG